MTPAQKEVLAAAVALVGGGLDGRECYLCYCIISDYVLNTEPPDAQAIKDEERRSRLSKLIEQAASAISSP